MIFGSTFVLPHRIDRSVPVFCSKGCVMTQDVLLDYLSKYVVSPKILSLDQLSASERQVLPECWIDIISSEASKRPKVALSYWTKYGGELDQVLEYLGSSLFSVDLIHHASGFCLLYGIRSADGSRVLYYEGRNPNSKQFNPVVLDVWESLPNKLKEFYDHIHNGWYYLASGSMGLSPVEDFFFLDDEEWGIVDELGKLPVSLKDTLAVYTNGMGGYLCLELKGSESDCLLWWSSKPPKLNLDFWAVADAWTAMGFEG